MRSAAQSAGRRPAPYALGIALWKDNRPAEAEAALREAIRLGQGEKAYREMLDRVVAARNR